ncbi:MULTISPECIES: acid phosphatase [unclassified Achromobacter]|uniref:acid phosphatase n=1 Tax=unclassified Achromobacter TaxID=2626865 RepID=UPI000B51C082|nr:MULTISPECIES: acid phosphatase [unclassified Achromobacter]OWT72662.1 acid phosphatase [Achromobacter sp. HZ34]OWT73879.1 acid phosphatase [Achromobacter sp. HZ28]
MKNTHKIIAPLVAVALATGLAACGGSSGDDDDTPSTPVTPPVTSTPAPTQEELATKAVDNIQNVVVIYAENRSFDNLYSDFPGIDSPLATATYEKQVDRDGTTVLTSLPQVWAGLTVPAAQFDTTVPTVTTTQTTGMVNAPFAINEIYPGVDINAVNADMWHNFYQNQMQINGGKNNMFAAWADNGGGLVMGHFTGNATNLPLWKVAQKYTMADHFFMGAFGGSFLNHQYLITAAAPVDPITTANVGKVSVLDDGPQGYHLTVKPASAGVSALTTSAASIFTLSGALTPDGYAVNTMQPPYQPSGVAPATVSGATPEPLLADQSNTGVLPPQSGPTIGDYLTDKNVEWAWYSGGWAFQTARATNPAGYVGSDYSGTGLQADGKTAFVNFQFHHQPFNYFKRFDPTTAAGIAERADHLKDGGVNGEQFIADIRAGKLPPVAFYKPVGNLNEHSGYADVKRGDQHIADIIAELEKSPQWGHMLVVVTYDENGGIWDHVAPPKGDRFGPGSRIPAIVAGPTVRKGYVDHTMYDTTSILRFITRRWDLPTLPGLQVREDGLKANGVDQGDLSNTLDTSATAS